MNQARESILKNIRQGCDEEVVKSLVEDFVVEDLGESLICSFINKLESVAGTVELIPNAKEIPFVVSEFLQLHNLPQKVVVDARLKSLPWPNKLRLAFRAAQADDVVSVCSAFAGIAETGSVVLLSSPDSPTTLNFLPDNHIVILRKDNLVAQIEEVWGRLDSMPRSINIITGPSRTADIEQTLQLGAHGPRRLHVILVDRCA
ncbi:protein containing DUF162 [Candidatus Thiomargarita nelsonii]|uniref:Protein containing DUF162 n=1 Tax=Candidatus Thiomargarita nelsonii TaxID=1003181 RepID=A0A176S5N8_9GAMM|nr:protein containing DUF162 [Candidatus Thiomargarita nelsonii]